MWLNVIRKNGHGMKTWIRQMGLSYRALATVMGQSAASISKKVIGIVPWQQSDLMRLHDHYGLSADFVLGLSTTSRAEKEDKLFSRYQ